MVILSILAETGNSQRLIKRLELDGHQIFTTNNEQTFWDYLIENHAQAIVLDLAATSGEFVSKIRDFLSHRNIYILALVSTPEVKEIEIHPLNRADEYLLKPVEPDELGSRLLVLDRYLKTLSETRSQAEHQQPVRDALTGTFSHATMLHLFSAEADRSIRTRKAFVLLLLELDESGDILHRYGTDIFQMTIRQVAQKIWACLRAYDLIGRWNDQGFMVILPQTSISGAKIVAERIQKNIKNVPMIVAGEAPFKLCASMGLSKFDQSDNNSVEELLSLAKSALMTASQIGSNQVVYSWEVN
jgi:diguanylate cyclase (GGDEF)-like protein